MSFLKVFLITPNQPLNLNSNHFCVCVLLLLLCCCRCFCHIQQHHLYFSTQIPLQLEHNEVQDRLLNVTRCNRKLCCHKRWMTKSCLKSLANDASNSERCIFFYWSVCLFFVFVCFKLGQTTVWWVPTAFFLQRNW